LGEGRLTFSATAAYSQQVDETHLREPVRRPGAEGSNTAVIIGDRLFLKAYRRYREGVNPELEMGRFLTEISPYDHIIPVLGALEYHEPDGTTATLAILQAYAPNQGDAWSYTMDYLTRFLEECLVSPPDETILEAAHVNFLLLMRRLGTRTGELHRALARETGDAAFDPEPVTGADLEAWAARIAHEAGESLAALQRTERLPEALSEGAGRVVAMAETLRRRIGELASGELDAVKTRHHGDFHLGQVLVAENDFLIIDFEGEPARPLAERRAKHSALRDVAGMLRSFSYAAFAARHRLTAERPADFATLAPYARDWEVRTTQAFLEGYEEAIQGCPVYPAGAEQARRLIELLTLEKVLYEIRYELSNRPDWAGIPLEGLLGLLGTE